MNSFISLILGGLSLVWISFWYPLAFDYLFISVNLEPIIGTCRDEFGSESCKPFARLLVWVMSLPLNAAVLTAYALVLVLGEYKLKKYSLNIIFLSTGVLIGYVIYCLIAGSEGIHYSYHFETAATYILIICFGVLGCNHLTKRSK